MHQQSTRPWADNAIYYLVSGIQLAQKFMMGEFPSSIPVWGIITINDLPWTIQLALLNLSKPCFFSNISSVGTKQWHTHETVYLLLTPILKKIKIIQSKRSNNYKFLKLQALRYRLHTGLSFVTDQAYTKSCIILGKYPYSACVVTLATKLVCKPTKTAWFLL